MNLFFLSGPGRLIRVDAEFIDPNGYLGRYICTEFPLLYP